MHRLRIVIAALGVLLIAAAGVIKFAVYPSVAKLPASSDTTNVYGGTARTLLNPAALVPGATAPLLFQNLPFQVTERVKVLSSNTDAAVVEYRLAPAAGGQALNVLTYKYAVDRKSLESTDAITAPGLTPSRGLTVSFPIGTEKQDYVGWVQDTGTTTPLKYSGTASHVSLPTATGTRDYNLGLETYVFKATTPPTPITDRQELAGFPASIPKAAIPGLVAKLNLPAALTAQLGAALAKLPANVPLAYTYASTFTYWVAPADGMVVNLQAVETRSVGLPQSLLGVGVPLATVAEFAYTDTPTTLAARLSDAKDNASKLSLVGTALPLLALGLGVLLLLVVGYLYWHDRHLRPLEPPPTEPALTGRTPSRL